MAAFVYIALMSMVAVSSVSGGLARLFGWRRVRFTLLASMPFGLLFSVASQTTMLVWVSRTVMVGIAAMLMFGLFEQWPKRLPRRLPRSLLQLAGIVVAVPLAAAVAYILTTGGDPQFETDRARVMGYAQLTIAGLLFAPWIAVGAMLKQRDLFAREQALAFQLERSQLERNVLDTRLRLLQAQVEPHFLFNTLANVQALVDAGSPQASKVLSSLTAYLRAAVPRIHESTTTLWQELELVRVYLELMQMRMPDRLQFALHIADSARVLRCPPMTLLTLVENAVRHGIDPGEVGGRIDVDVRRRDNRCCIRVSDSGVGLGAASKGLGTGLATLRERLQLTFGLEAQLRLSEVSPHGVSVELEFPAREQE